MPENRQILIASLPQGALAASDFELHDAAVPEPGDGEVLVRTLAITIGAGQRAGLQGSASYAGAPTTGVVMSRHRRRPRRGVERSGVRRRRRRGRRRPGWQDYSVQPAGRLAVVDDDGDPALHLGVLGTNGLTAYFGLLDVGRPQAGETVVVSAASGSVGHLVGQLARITGCRVVGVAGSDEKCAVLTGQLGFDAAVNHRDPSVPRRFKAATGAGIDVYFDNTGGDILGAALRRMRPHGRIVCCGVVSQYDTADPAPGPAASPAC